MRVHAARVLQTHRDGIPGTSTCRQTPAGAAAVLQPGCAGRNPMGDLPMDRSGSKPVEPALQAVRLPPRSVQAISSRCGPARLADRRRIQRSGNRGRLKVNGTIGVVSMIAVLRLADAGCPGNALCPVVFGFRPVFHRAAASSVTTGESAHGGTVAGRPAPPATPCREFPGVVHSKS